jgi:D-tyrosyl-tRNA(Tyr) deacylase
MRALVQRVIRAEVRSKLSASEHLEIPDPARKSGFVVAGQIGPGLCVLLGVTHTDSEATAIKMAEKIWHLRILDDAQGAMNLSLAQVAETKEESPQSVMIVSQFTLYGDTAKGRRPSWVDAARPEIAEPLIERVVAELRAMGATVATGVFRTEMQVELVNDGPVTLLLEI